MMDIPDRLWSMRLARPDDASAIAALLSDVFGNWGDQATWSWKFEGSPAPYRLKSAVAEVDGRLVGHYGIVPVNMIQQGKVIRGAQAVDAAVLPEFRRQGMFATLAGQVFNAAADQQVDFIYARSGLFSLNLNRQIGFQPVMIVPEMILLLGSINFLGAQLRSLPGDLASFWRWRTQQDWSPEILARLDRFRSSLIWLVSWLNQPGLGRNIPVSDITIRKLTGFDDSFDHFWELCQPVKALGLVKDCAYLSWRYSQHPNRVYQILGAFEAGNLVGYLVLHKAKFKSSICELEILPGKDQAIFSLVQHAAQAAKESGSLALAIWVSNHSPLRLSLQKAGFNSQHSLHHLAAKHKSLSARFYKIIVHTEQLSAPIKEHCSEVIDGWSLSMGDSDLI